MAMPGVYGARWRTRQTLRHIRHTKSWSGRCVEGLDFRLLLVEPPARGFGLGRYLVNECVHFAKSAARVKPGGWRLESEGQVGETSPPAHETTFRTGSIPSKRMFL